MTIPEERDQAAEGIAVNTGSATKGQAPYDPRIYLAVERTFLAWIRTALGLMGFGFVSARFGLFLREEAAHGNLPPQHTGLSLPVGVCLIALGVIISVVSAVRHQRQIAALDKGVFRTAFGAPFGVATAGIVAIMGTVIAIYLAM